MKVVLFVAGNFFALAIAGMIVDLTLRSREPWRRALAVLVGFPVVAVSVVLVLGSLSMLTAQNAVLAVGPVAVLIFPVWWRRTRKKRALGAAAAPNASKRSTVSIEIGAGFLATFAALYVVKCLIGPTGFWSDCLVYHATAAANWIRDGKLGYLTVYQGHYPLNAEAFTSWILLPFGRDGAAGYSGFYWVAVATTAIVGLVRNLGQRWAVAFFTAGLFLASHCVLRDALRFAATDVAFAAMTLAAVALSSPSRTPVTSSAKVADAGYAGVAIGFAIGSKVISIPVAGVLLIWFALGQKTLLDRRARTVAAITIGLCSLLGGAYWYVRNWVVTGNPLFPAELGPFAGPFTAEDQYRTKLLYWLFSDPAGLAQQLRSLGRIANWGIGLGVVSFGGYAYALSTLLRGTRDERERLRDPAWFLPAATGALLILLYPLMPFSGRVDHPDAPLTVSSRYVIVPFAIGLVLYSSLFALENRRASLWFSVAVLGSMTSWLNPYTRWAIPPADPLILIPRRRSGPAGLGVGLRRALRRANVAGTRRPAG